MTLEHRILEADDPAAKIVHELLAPEHDVMGESQRSKEYLWAVTVDGETVLAAHRALTAHGCLYLRGVYAFQATGFPAAYMLARFLLKEALRRGITRSHVWVETTGRERKIAELLGARTTSRPLHRYRLPIFPQPKGKPKVSSGTVELPGSTQIEWIVDKTTTVLFGTTDREGLPRPVPFDETIDYPWEEFLSTEFIEISVPASDIPATLALVSRGARRVSRYPVLHGNVDPEEPLR